MASDQADDEAAGGKNCAGIEAGFHPFCEDKAHSGQDSIDCFASVVVVLIFRLSGSAVFGETAIFRVS